MKGFRDFITRGNLIELAVAFIMGAAFTTVVKAFTDLIMNIITRVIGGQADFNAIVVAGVPIGPLIGAIVNFLLVALVVYFAIVRPINAWHERHQDPDEEAAPDEVALLTQIRDLLATEAPAGSSH